MALDPSLFMQGAQLRQQNARDQQAIVGNFFDRLTQQQQYDEKRKLLEREMAMKEAEAARKAAMPDIEPLAQVGLFKMQSGQEPTGQEAAAIRTLFLLKPPAAGYNPVTGRMESGPSPLDALGLKPIPMPTRAKPSAPPQAMQALGIGPQAVETQDIPPISEGDLMAPQGISVDGPAPKPSVIDVIKPNEYVPPKPDEPVVTRQDAAAYESKLKVAEEQEKANIDVEKKKKEGMPSAKRRLSEIESNFSGLDKTIDDALKMAGPATTGAGSYLANIKGTKARDLEELVKTIEADAAFSELQTMRDNSPTGGALGSVAVEELKLLTAAKAAISTAQTEKQFKYHLRRYRDARKSALERVRKAYKETYGEDQDTTSDPIMNAIDEEIKRRGLNGR